MLKPALVAFALMQAGEGLCREVDDPPVGARQASAEVWLYTDAMATALQPLAPLAGRVVREGLCPALPVASNGVVWVYQAEARFAERRKRDRAWAVEEVRFANPSGCEALDGEVRRLLIASLPQFMEPRADADSNGWYRIPKIQLRVDD